MIQYLKEKKSNKYKTMVIAQVINVDKVLQPDLFVTTYEI